MEDLKKIELDSKSINTPIKEASQIKNSRKLPKKIPLIFLILIIILGVGIFFGIVLPAQQVYSSANKTYQQARKAWDAVKKQNIELADKELAKTKEDLKETQNKLNALSYLKFIPVASGYYNDADHAVKAGSHGLDAAVIIIEALKPYTDVLGLKGQGSFVMGSAEERIKTAIMTMGKITPRIDEVSKSLSLAKTEIDAIDPNHYPSFGGGEKIKDQIIKVKKIADEGIGFIEEARPLVKVLPSLLGDTKERKYLVLFQNDKELRPTGGFITAYSIFRIDKGIIHVDKSDDIYTLDNSIGRKPVAPAPILKYLPKVSTFNLRDSNLSPDFYESMKTFESFYQKAPGRIDVDGIIAIDTNILLTTIKILDDEVTASGLTFTTKEDKRCNCPQVIYSLEDNISRPVNYTKSGRKDLLGSLLYAIMGKALSSSPKVYWGPLFQALSTQTQEKHILFYLYNNDAQKGAEALNFAGRIKAFEGDYLHINDTNFGGQKSNMFVKEAVEQKYETKSDGSIVKTITISYKNPYPPSDCNLERGGLCLNAVLRNWLRIYVPKGSEIISSKGSEVKMSTYDELGKTVFDGFLTVKPEGAATFTITYRLPFKLTSGSPLPLLIQKQSGTDKNEYTIKVNGREKEKFPLATDKEVKLNF
ncbi:DUF4012 domain-containing protein [Candidatus Microgenomates bacterium]|nr:MAG: DUF4012 domain-containing protein [Candidatus Microgenomates bacterium]